MMYLMPAQNPRLTVTLKPSTYAQIQQVSRLTGNSQSAMVAEILEQSEPVFTRLIQVLEAAQQAKDELRTKAASNMAVAQARIEQQIGLALGEFDGLTGNLLEDVEAIKRRARRTTQGQPKDGTSGGRGAREVVSWARSTPPSNRGVRSTPKPPTKAEKAAPGRE